MSIEIAKSSRELESELSANSINVIALSLMLTIFILDLFTPLGIADGICYVGVMLLSMLTNDKRFTLLVAITGVILITTGYFLSPKAPNNAEAYVAITNRFLSITVVIVSAIVIVKNKTLKQKVVERTEQLENSNKELESFNFISSHDLQEPLRKIKNFVSVLLKSEETNLSERGKYYLQRMAEASKQIQMFIEDLLIYSRTRNAPRNFSNTDLKEIVNEVIFNLEEAIKEKKANINIDELCRAKIIRYQYRQLMHNLISNSLKFSHPDRQPEIIIKSEIVLGKKLNNPKLQPKTKYCHTTVIDNGIGFEVQYKELIFELFQRLHEYDKYKGSGIGLSVCKRIAENHNGIITATAKQNEGAQFDIYIPTE